MIIGFVNKIDNHFQIYKSLNLQKLIITRAIKLIVQEFSNCQKLPNFTNFSTFSEFLNSKNFDRAMTVQILSFKIAFSVFIWLYLTSSCPPQFFNRIQQINAFFKHLCFIKKLFWWIFAVTIFEKNAFISFYYRESYPGHASYPHISYEVTNMWNAI